MRVKPAPPTTKTDGGETGVHLFFCSVWGHLPLCGARRDHPLLVEPSFLPSSSFLPSQPHNPEKRPSLLLVRAFGGDTGTTSSTRVYSSSRREKRGWGKRAEEQKREEEKGRGHPFVEKGCLPLPLSLSLSLPPHVPQQSASRGILWWEYALLCVRCVLWRGVFWEALKHHHHLEKGEEKKRRVLWNPLESCVG